MSETNEEKPVVMVRCRRGNDKMTQGQSCESLRAYNLTPLGSKLSAFKCATCNFEWTVAVGGAFNF